MSDEINKTTVEHQFDALCRKAIRDEKTDYHRETKRYLNKLQKLQDAQEQSYLDDPFDFIENEIDYKGFKIKIRSEHLYKSILDLDANRKEIILLYYFMNKNDAEIAKTLHQIKRTVNNKRNDALKTLRESMGKEDD